jgi:hypothetical protein
MSSVFGMSLDASRRGFFDRSAVEKAVDRAKIRQMSKAGSFVRRSARQSIRKSDASSAPGQAPKSHTGILKDFIFFQYDKSSDSVVVGPARLNGRVTRDAPSVLEYGGHVNIFGKRRNIQPRPYMVPAFKENEAQIANIFKDSVK